MSSLINRLCCRPEDLAWGQKNSLLCQCLRYFRNRPRGGLAVQIMVAGVRHLLMCYSGRRPGGQMTQVASSGLSGDLPRDPKRDTLPLCACPCLLSGP